MIEHVRTVYRKDDLSSFLQPGVLEPLALPGQSYKLAFTPGLLAQKYRRNPDTPQEENLLPDAAQVLSGKDDDQGGYVDLDSDGHWWISSEKSFFSLTADSANPSLTAQTELNEAQQHFFTPRKFLDPFDRTHSVDYDPYDLLVLQTTDALQNVIAALNDYRVLLSHQMTDPNGNRSQVKFDALGMVVGTVRTGKANGPVEGDSFDNFTTDLTPQQIADYFDATNPRSLAVAHLGTATSRVIYDLERVPICAASISRETHVSDLDQDEETKVRLSFVYSDGLAREAQTKDQAEPGPLDTNDPNAPVLDPRWVSTGATIYNNKGKPVRRFEPFFSATHNYGIEQHGVSSTLFYDPADRVVATLFPNHSWEKVVFDAWRHATYEVNDTVQNAGGSTDPKSDDDVKGFFSRLPDADYLPTWYEQRIALAPNHPERIAADKTAIHRQTPTVIHLDTLGRTFLTVAHNRFERNGSIIEEKYNSRVELDIEGNARTVRDAVTHNNDPLGRIVMRYDYDMLGNQIHNSSMEAGEQWNLNDVTGMSIRTWDSRGFKRRLTYDELRRPTGLFVTAGGAERLAERTVYGESQGATNNLRTRVFQLFDAAGVVTSEVYDFKGNLLSSKRDLLPDYKGEVDWNQNPAPNDGTFITTRTFDALDRLMTVTAPDESVYRPSYNEANLLDKVEVNVHGAAQATPFVTNVNYNARGQRLLIQYANGATTTYEYDTNTFRLVHLKTTRAAAQNGLASQIFSNTATVQDLRYTYDPAGNITRIEDAALPTIFHDNQQVAPVCEYTYDATYRLIEAHGREHIGQMTFDFAPPSGNYRDHPFAGAGANVNDLQALRNYTQRYEYDAVGNFQKLIHEAGPNGSWTRSYAYNSPSLVESGKQNNRLTGTTVGQTNETYAFDAHGNTTSMPHLTVMQWDFKDQLRATSKQVVNNNTPETTFYVYDAMGKRVRKVTERQNETRRNERIYLGGFEIYREYNGNGVTVTLERETFDVVDNEQRIASIETKTIENSNPINTPAPLQRYQLANHLGSTSLELDQAGLLITYEEYHPYGTTAFQAMNSAAELSLKRYRYIGKERDEETGFHYHGARYFAPWLARWISTDPIAIAGGINLYQYANSEPISLKDDDGKQPKKAPSGGATTPQKPKAAVPTAGGLTFATTSAIKAADMKKLIDKSPIPKELKDAFTVQGDKLVMKNMPKNATSLMESIYWAMQDGWHVTTGTIKWSDKDKKNSNLKGDFETDDEPGVRVTERDGTKRWSPNMKISDDRSGETLPPEGKIFEFTPQGSTTPRTLTPKGTEMRDFTEDPHLTPTSRGDRGLLIVSNQEEDVSGKTTKRSDNDIVKTFLHELGAHAGLLNQALPWEHNTPGSKSDQFVLDLDMWFMNSAQQAGQTPAQAPAQPPAKKEEEAKPAPKPAPPNKK